MLRKTAFFLILLRLAIGWHFFFEGWHKIHSHSIGTTVTNRPFSSEGYFRNATGPLGPVIRGQLSDPDDAALARLTPKPVPAGKDGSTADRLPGVLNAEIDDYTKRFLDSFHLDDAEQKQAEKIAAAAKGKIADFLLTSVPEEQHVGEYRGKLDEYRKLSAEKTMMLGREQDNARLAKIKSDIVQARKDSLDELDKEIGKTLHDPLGGILKKKLATDRLSIAIKTENPFLLPHTPDHTLPSDYDARWHAYLDAFKAVYPLTNDQEKLLEEKFSTAKRLTTESLAEEQGVPFTVVIALAGTPGENPYLTCSSALATRQGVVGEELDRLNRYLKAALTDEQAKGMPPAVKPEPSVLLHRIDLATMWGLTIIGACLLLGLLTRTNCVLAAGFLLLTYLAAPPFPWLSTAPNNEGTYLFVNKNMVEMLALLVLATTASGRWFGLDAILHRIFGREKPVTVAVPSRTRAA